MILKILPALSGDSLLLSWLGFSGKICNLLMDGGVTNTYNLSLKPEIQALIERHEQIDLLILSHIDSDHIGGLLRLVNEIHSNRLPERLIMHCWFNSARVLSNYFEDVKLIDKEISLPYIGKQLSSKQGHTLENFLVRLKIQSNTEPIQLAQQHQLDGLVIDILSPGIMGLRRLSKSWPPTTSYPVQVPLSNPQTDYHVPIQELIDRPFQEDTGVPNGSSIALLVTYNAIRILLLADSHPSTIIEALVLKGYSSSNRLKVDCVKVSHHGSKHNTMVELLEIIECYRFIICTNGHNAHGLPHKESLSRIIYHNHSLGRRTELIFNYHNSVTASIFSQNEMLEFNFFCSFQNQVNFTL